MKNEKEEITTKDNLIDWLVYSIISGVFLIPFLGGQWSKHICASIIIGFVLGMLNRIIRELNLLNKK